MWKSTTERQLLSKAISGDRVALQELLLVYHRPLTSHIQRRLPSQIQGVVDTDDIVQQTFVRVVREIEHFQP